MGDAFSVPVILSWTFIKGLLTIQDQELFKSHYKGKLRQQYRKSRFSGDKTALLAVSFHHA